MNNKEKREYISCLHLMENIQLCRPEEIVRVREVLSKCPDSFFKYKKIGKYTFDMLENKYAFLSQVKDLDDPFDCLSDFNTSSILKSNDGTVTNRFLQHIVKESKMSLSKKQSKLVKETRSAFKPGNAFETSRVSEALKEAGVPEEQINNYLVKYKNLMNLDNTFDKNGTFERFGSILMNPGEAIGVCSLSEINDNKVMWSLYGKKYEGCCIEYHIIRTKKARRFLFPVIYSRKPNNNFSEKVFDTTYAEMMRQTSNDIFHLGSEIGSVGAIYELFCTKDIDWKHQREWRLVGDANEKFYDVEIKAVYLGFKVKKTNETKMISYAKKHHFTLYKMKAPDGKKKIRYKKIV